MLDLGETLQHNSRPEGFSRHIRREKMGTEENFSATGGDLLLHGSIIVFEGSATRTHEMLETVGGGDVLRNFFGQFPASHAGSGAGHFVTERLSLGFVQGVS